MDVMEINVTFFQGGIHNTDRPDIVTLEYALNHIREGVEFEPRIRQLRAESDKAKRQEIKKGLSYFLFSGIFSKRNAKSLEEHSGLIILDFDNLQDITGTRLQLQSDPYTLALFRSPSGDGLKLLVRIDPEKHLDSFKELEKYFATEYGLELDKSGKDVSRACYTSADNGLYFNPEAQVFLTTVLHQDDKTEVVKELPRSQAPRQSRRLSDVEYATLIAERIASAGIDITQSYDDWMLLAFSLSTLGEDGRTLFHKLSSFHADYSPKACDDRFNEASKNCRFTSPAWLYRKAKDLGIDTTIPRADNAGQPAPARKKMEEPEDDGNYTYNWPQGVSWKAKEDRQESEKCVRWYQHFSYKNQLYMATFKIEEGTTTVSFKKVSNFSIQSYYLVMDEEGKANRIIKAINVRNQEFLAMVPTEAFTSVQEFSKFIERGNYYHSMTKNHFTTLKAKIYDDAKDCRTITTLGQQPEGFFAFANGIFAGGRFLEINEYGVVEFEKRHYFLPALSRMFREQLKNYQFERNFRYVPRSGATFVDWAELFCKVYGENGRIALVFYVMSIFSDLIFKVDGFFPLLFCYGKPSSGKTTMAVSLLSMFHPTGDKTVGVNINNIPMPALFRTLAQVRNGVVLIEEYQNDLEKFKVENLKGIWNRTPPTKTDTSQSNTSNRTVSTAPESAAIITGQHLPNQDVALFTRCILLSFFQNDHYTDDQRLLFREIKNLQGGSLTQITGEVLKCRTDFDNDFQKSYEKEKKDFSGTFKKTNVNRIGDHCAQIMATYNTLAGKLKFPFTAAQLRQTVLDMAAKQVDMMVTSDESFTFWEVVNLLFFKSLISEETDFAIRELNSIKIKPHGEKTEQVIELNDTRQLLFLRLSKVHGMYLTEMRQQGRKNAMDKTSLIQYLTNSKQFIGQKDNFRFKDSVSSCYVFDYTALADLGIVLERHESVAMTAEDLKREASPSSPFPIENINIPLHNNEPDVF